jgi:hypothetical protein
MTREAKSPDPAFDFGVVVQITPKGFHPQTLVSPCCSPVIWVNLTDRPQTIAFLTLLPPTSSSIPSGGSFLLTPHNAGSFAYHEAGSPTLTGVVQVTSTNES